MTRQNTIFDIKYLICLLPTLFDVHQMKFYKDNEYLYATQMF